MTNKDIAKPAPLMAGKRGLIMGVANDRSIAWGIARVLAGQGAKLAFTYQGDAFGRRAILIDSAIALVLTTLIFLAFDKLLTLSLPAGPLERLL